MALRVNCYRCLETSRVRSPSVECSRSKLIGLEQTVVYRHWLMVLMGMREVDRFIFLIACPILLVFQIVILTMFIKNQPLLTKPGNIFFALVVLEVGLNLHLICSSRTCFDKKFIFSWIRLECPLTLEMLALAWDMFSHSLRLIIFPIFSFFSSTLFSLSGIPSRKVIKYLLQKLMHFGDYFMAAPSWPVCSLPPACF